ncbi:TetR/AcrR family transcriptional regulator [Allostreptomyces psammosilenae]|uniref:AcrR family transcriptional regulator n=1 Tax=Allostreptomyces psammosilenae TaxID=1892865 RepID=A0A853A4W1_9ACTN|nr:TetR/AcrR family transcriptional regulator [Allostreptomyces psammosilenae]NYI05532.1 AcrR family transcriptional regulator [Allostreptomyces psammosilenae]
MKAKAPTSSPEDVADRRLRRSRRTRNALATAAVELVLERGLGAVTVEAIAERADVARRTFSRHFAGKEDAALDFVRADGDRINALLRARPADEPPLLAYRRAVQDWLTDPEDPPRHVRPPMRRLLALLDTEPTLFAAYQRIRLDAQAESVRVIADRIGGTDGDGGRGRAAIVVDAAAGVLTAALRLWLRAGADHPERPDRPEEPDRPEHGPGAAELAEVVERAYDALLGEAARAASHAAG